MKGKLTKVKHYMKKKKYLRKTHFGSEKANALK
jgi:hypothetical protein